MAIFIDGGHISKLAANEFGVQVDYQKLSAEIAATIDAKTVEPVELLRALFYNCLPYQSAKPTPDEAKRYGASQKFHTQLEKIPRFQVRLGRLAFRGVDAQGRPIFQQKRVDLMLGLDFALLAGGHQIQHAAILTGDSDFIPAVEVAKQEGVCIWHIHGPAVSKVGGKSTYAQELWDMCDERIELTQAFMNKVKR
ncbi:MAG: NYN domain-containing protein [Acidimicrobiales bacterium]